MGSAPSQPFYAALKIYVRNSKDKDNAVDRRMDRVSWKIQCFFGLFLLIYLYKICHEIVVFLNIVRYYVYTPMSQ